MRRLPISKLKSGMILGKSLYSANGGVLLSAGTELDSTYAKRLQALGFPAVIIIDSFCKDVEFPDIVSDGTRIDGIIKVRRVFEEARKFQKIDTKLVKDLVNKLVDEVLQNREMLFEFPDSRSYDSYMYAHCLNVCILSLRIGMALNYNEVQLRDLGLGAVMHDVGSIFIDSKLIDKPGSLSSTEFSQIQQHSIKGFNLLRDQKDINLLAAHVAFQHHERIDGTGYPRALKNTDICEFARIVAIADLFDALTSDRKHRQAYSNSEAIKMIKVEAGLKIDKVLTELFLHNIASYAAGSLLELSSGEIGLVVSNKRQYLEKPVVRIVAESTQSLISSANVQEIELAKEPGLTIVRELQPDDGFTDKLRDIHNREKKVVNS
ncbi:HD-GYP domain-containing protein [Phosphitispora sp. TUW77]|uniref:HD-GYP domain-containing protein n=1 Tax=Phosphitispora sp. TUW77 TaxID=3152361 RepID=UPI003AB35AE6